ncbi:extracellular solute-binding protein [Cohnella fermenti]|uniref:extracellular solute-binding protein n=1 Tax=Cohnella fermenti TaxID=2565925 RepID=UPI001E432B9C|nr:extracellular solute-binding protein [Cohnella fermenti]
MQNKQRGKFGSLFAVLLISSLLAACSNEGNAGPKEEAGGSATEAPTPISIMTTFYGDEPPGPDNVVIKEIEKRTNTKLTITWVSPNSYGEKVNVTLASGDIPDLTLIGDNFSASVRKMAEQGAFWELEPYLKDYANLSAFPQESWDNTRYQDGKIYAIPRVRALSTGMVEVRKDWLDKLGLPVPETMDDLYNVMRAFTYDDPDGNGKQDTVGIVADIASDGLSLGTLSHVLYAFQGAAEGWKLDGNGKLANMMVDSSTRAALEWLRKAYGEGLIHRDFVTLKNSQSRDIVMAGKAGIAFEAISAAWTLTDGIRQNDPNGDMLPLASLTGPSGVPYMHKGRGYNGVFVIPKSVSEEKMKKILEFMDFGASQEGYELGVYGFEGIHYTKEGEFYSQTEQAKKDIVSNLAMGQIFTRFDPYSSAFSAGITADYYNRSKQIVDEIGKISTGNPSEGLYSETWSKYRNDFMKKITDVQVKVIIGQLPLESWDQEVQSLLADPNWTKAMQELNEAYVRKNGK